MTAEAPPAAQNDGYGTSSPGLLAIADRDRIEVNNAESGGIDARGRRVSYCGERTRLVPFCGGADGPWLHRGGPGRVASRGAGYQAGVRQKPDKVRSNLQVRR